MHRVVTHGNFYFRWKVWITSCKHLLGEKSVMSAVMSLVMSLY